MSPLAAQLQTRLATIRSRIEAATARANRDSHHVTLVAVTKYASAECVQALIDLGERELGESRPQQLEARAAQFTAADSIRWHLVGHLQRNKARRMLPVVELIHSVDSLRLLAALDRLAEEADVTPHVLLEVNMSGEEAKHGFSPDGLRTAWGEAQTFERIRIEGLMTMAARSDDPEDARPAFRGLRELRDELGGVDKLPHLSMGMSGDFEIAVEEGATLVRIGSALFEGLTEGPAQ